MGGAGAVRFFLGNDVSPDGAFFSGATPDIEDDDDEDEPAWPIDPLPDGPPDENADDDEEDDDEEDEDDGDGAAVRGEGGRETLPSESPREGLAGAGADGPPVDDPDGVDGVVGVEEVRGRAPPRAGAAAPPAAAPPRAGAGAGPPPLLGPARFGAPAAGRGRAADEEEEDEADEEGDEGTGRAGAIPWGWCGDDVGFGDGDDPCGWCGDDEV